MNVWPLLARWAETKKPAVVVTLLESPGCDEARPGLMAVAEGPGADFEGPLTRASFWKSDLARLSEAFPPPEDGRLVEAEGRRYYVAPLSYNRSALVLGGGHVGSALGRLLLFLDFEVTLMDDRPEFLTIVEPDLQTVEAPFSELSGRFAGAAFDALIIVTRGHAQDTLCLRQVLSWARRPSYVGMIGSRRRTAETLEMLASEGLDRTLLEGVHTPVGLKIGAQTPAEIAVSIAAEIIQVLNRG